MKRSLSEILELLMSISAAELPEVISPELFSFTALAFLFLSGKSEGARLATAPSRPPDYGGQVRHEFLLPEKT